MKSDWRMRPLPRQATTIHSQSMRTVSSRESDPKRGGRDAASPLFRLFGTCNHTKRYSILLMTSLLFSFFAISVCSANEACLSAIKNSVPNPETVQVKDAILYKNVKEHMDELLRIKLSYAARHLGEKAKIERQCLVVDRDTKSTAFQKCVSENVPASVLRGIERIETLNQLTKSIVEGKKDISAIRYRYWYLWILGTTNTAFSLCVIQPSGVFLISVNWREHILRDDD